MGFGAMNENQNLWVLMGFLVGFYGNWYFNLISTLEEQMFQNSGTAVEVLLYVVLGVSAFSLFYYCYEITSTKRGKSWIFPHSFYLSSIHLVSTYYLLVYIEGNLLPPNPVSMIGILLWVFLILREIDWRKK